MLHCLLWVQVTPAWCQCSAPLMGIAQQAGQVTSSISNQAHLLAIRPRQRAHLPGWSGKRSPPHRWSIFCRMLQYDMHIKPRLYEKNDFKEVKGAAPDKHLASFQLRGRLQAPVSLLDPTCKGRMSTGHSALPHTCCQHRSIYSISLTDQNVHEHPCI